MATVQDPKSASMEGVSGTSFAPETMTAPEISYVRMESVSGKEKLAPDSIPMGTAQDPRLVTMVDASKSNSATVIGIASRIKCVTMEGASGLMMTLIKIQMIPMAVPDSILVHLTNFATMADVKST